MKIHKLKDDELHKLVALSNPNPETKFKALTELGRRQAKRQFIYGTLVAWLAMVISIGSLTIAILSYNINNKAPTMKQTCNQPQRP